MKIHYPWLASPTSEPTAIGGAYSELAENLLTISFYAGDAIFSITGAKGYLRRRVLMMNSPRSPHRMGLFGLTLMTASNMMGSGVFMLPASLARLGSLSCFGWGLTFLVVVGLAFIFNKINQMAPEQGGIIANIQECFGPYVGLQMTMFYWISTWVGNCALLLAVVGYLSFFFPILHYPLYGAIASVTILWCAVGFGLLGAREIGRAQLLTGGCMVGAILIIAFGGWGKFDSQLYLQSWNVSGHSESYVVISAAALSLWGFLGIESASVASGQVKNARHIVPLATFFGLTLTGICYTASCNTIMGILPHHTLISSISPFAETARHLWGNRAGELISVAVIIACIGAIPGWQLLQTEVLATAAKKKLLPALFAVRNRYGVPWISLVVTASLMTAVLFLTQCASLQQQFTMVIEFAVVASLFPYLFAVLSLPLMLLTGHASPHRSRGLYIVLSIIVFIALAAAIYFQPPKILYLTLFLQMISTLLFVFRPRKYAITP